MKFSAFNECRQTITDEDIVGAKNIRSSGGK